MERTRPPVQVEKRDSGSTPGSGRSLGGGLGSPLQYSCLEHPTDRGAWWATVHRVSKSRKWPKWRSTLCWPWGQLSGIQTQTLSLPSWNSLSWKKQKGILPVMTHRKQCWSVRWIKGRMKDKEERLVGRRKRQQWGSSPHEGFSGKSTYSIKMRNTQTKVNWTQRRTVHSIRIRTKNPWRWVLKVLPLKMPSGTLGWKDLSRPKCQQRKSMSNHFFLHYASTLQRFPLTETRSKFRSALVFKFIPPTNRKWYCCEW